MPISTVFKPQGNRTLGKELLIELSKKTITSTALHFKLHPFPFKTKLDIEKRNLCCFLRLVKRTQAARPAPTAKCFVKSFNLATIPKKYLFFG